LVFAQSDSGYEKAPIPKVENEKNISRFWMILSPTALPECSPKRWPPAAFAGRVHKCQTGGRAGHFDGLFAIWLGMALQKTGGKLTTYEIDAGRAAALVLISKRPG
jgi:hypothetical protein